MKGRTLEFCRTWLNQTEVTVEGLHFLQEDSPDEIGKALQEFIKPVRTDGSDNDTVTTAGVVDLGGNFATVPFISAKS